MKHMKTVWTALMLAAVMAIGLGLAACGTPQFTVTFESNGGSAVAAVTVDKDGKVEKPADPTKEDCIFGGWFKDNTTFGESWNFDTDTVTGDVTLYAKWTPLADCTVTFDSKGGSAVQADTVKAGKKLTKPTDPTRARYRFDGWFKDAAGETAWNFDTDTVTGDVTLYAKWTQIEAGEIAWVKPVAGSVVIPDDVGLFNPDYRKTLEDFAPEVYATEDGERLATIIVDTDADFSYDETTHKLTPGSYTVTYETRDSMNESHEDTFDVVVKSAEEINYYVYANQDKSGKSGVCGIDFSAAVGGIRIRVAHDKYFEVTDVENLPEAIRNPHAEGKIIDFDDPFIIKNADDVALTLNTADAMAEYTVFDSHGVVVFGWNGANGRGVDENNKYTLGKNGGINATTVTVPAGGYVLIVGYTASGNWYGKVTGGKAISADDYWGTKAEGAGVPQYDMDGRQFASTGFNYRWKNVVQLKKGADVLTGDYVNQAPYMSAGYQDAQIVIGSAKPTKESLIAGVTFKDDNGTFAIDDDVTVTEGIAVTDESYNALNTAEAGNYQIVFEVTDPDDETLKATFEKTVIVFIPTQYMKVGSTYLNAPKAEYNKNYGKEALGGDNTVFMWDKAYEGEAATIPTAQYTVYIVIDKTTGKLIEAQNWSNLYNAENPNGTTVTSGNNLEGARLRFGSLTDDELLIVFSQGAVRDFGAAVINAAKGANFAQTYIQIADLAGINIPVTE